MPPDTIPQAIIDGAHDAMDNIHSNIMDYIFKFRRSAYRNIATDLRTLLLDTNAIKSFGGRWKETNQSLFEVVYRQDGNIFIPAMVKGWSAKDKARIEETSMPITPAPATLITKMRTTENMVPLSNWLEADYVRTKKRGWLKVNRLLRLTADREGAHLLNRTHEKDLRKDIFDVLWGPPELNENTAEQARRTVWEQFIIQAGIALLFSAKYQKGEYFRLFNYDIHAKSDEEINAFVQTNPEAQFTHQWGPQPKARALYSHESDTSSIDVSTTMSITRLHQQGPRLDADQ